MNQEKRRRGRPRLDTRLTEYGAPSRRQAVNAMYMYEGVQLISVAATEIPDHELLWYSDDATHTVKSKDGILEQLGRMLIQDLLAKGDCIYIANLAIAALKNGEKSRDIENAIRNIRMAVKRMKKDSENTYLQKKKTEAVWDLYVMGGRFAVN